MASERNCNGLFACTRCGDCCNGYGGTYLADVDIEAIAEFIGVSVRRFKTHYTRASGGKRLIVQGGNGYCIFWDQVCTIHPVKPHMCRQWPFIRSLLVDVGNWRAMASTCPGMNPDASPQRILACVNRHLPS